jgi:SAM-dependent methyltransferase
VRTNVKSLIWYLATHHEFTAPVVDLGSRQSPNQLATSDLRQLFRGKDYLGCDMALGVGVDQVENLETLSFGDKSLPTILCLDTLEHVGNPIQAMKELSRVIADDGVLVVTSHMYAPVHYDPDYWRFSPQCFHDVLLRDFPGKLIFTIGDRSFPELVGAIATKAAEVPFVIDWPELNSMLLWSYPFPFSEWRNQ